MKQIEIVSDGRSPVGTVTALDSGLFEGMAWRMDCGVGLPLLLGEGRSIDCGAHRTKVAAVEAVLRATGVYSVWDT
jgi:hypothetical protein